MCKRKQRKIYALVQFEDGVYYICGQGNIYNSKNAETSVKYSNGSRYKAQVLYMSTNLVFLSNKKRSYENYGRNLLSSGQLLEDASDNISFNNDLRLQETNDKPNETITSTPGRKASNNLNSTYSVIDNSTGSYSAAEMIEEQCQTIIMSTPLPERCLSFDETGVDANLVFLGNKKISYENYERNLSSSGQLLEDASDNIIFNNDLRLQETNYKPNETITSTPGRKAFNNLNSTYSVIDNSTGSYSAAEMIEEQCQTIIMSTPLPERCLSFDETGVDASQESCDSLSDPEYIPQKSSSSSDTGTDTESDLEKSNSRNHNKNQSSSFGDVSSASTPGKYVRDDADMFVDISDGKRGQQKRTFCKYCNKMQSKFARHLENVHKDIDEVKAFSILPKKCPERRNIIDKIRKKSQYFFNTNATVNDGELLVCRRPKALLKKNACDYQVCQNCRGFFSKNNIRHHAQICFGYNGKKNRTLMVMGRRVAGRIHPEASKTLRREVFPVMREDNIARVIRYDRLIILYGNKMCCKYRLQHQHEMIRAQLRVLGRFLIALKEINKEVVEFSTLYDPKFYDCVILAINIVAGFEEQTNTYKAPSTAYSLGTLIKKIGNFLITDCIKRHDTTQKTNAEDFLKLLVEDIGITVNKTVVESQTQQKRRKKIELPSVKDIRKLLAYLTKMRKSAFDSLQKEFTFNEWLTLAQATLTSVQVFNRRRAGEIERMFIEDFENYERINQDLLKTLSSDTQKVAKKYVRFVIRGKLNRTVPVLLPEDLLLCIQTILTFRIQAKVPIGNRYVFGIPGFQNKRYKYLRACYLLRKFAKESGVNIPANLTGTKLRKHIATNCINLNLSDNEIADVANFMGHTDKIHREHYRQPIASREILRMSKVLELAQGGDENETDNSDITEDEEDINDVGISETFKYTKPKAKEKKKNRSNNSEITDEEDIDDVDISETFKYTKQKANEKKKKRSTSPYGAVKSKKRWSQEETDAAYKLFSEYIKNQCYPSLKTIQRLSSQYRCLSCRSPSIIKTWISNKIKKKQKIGNDMGFKKKLIVNTGSNI